MIQKETLVVPSDKVGVWLTRTIHVYAKLSRILKVNQFGKCSIVSTSGSRIGLKKKKKKFLYTRSGVIYRRLCGLSALTHRSHIMLKKRLTPFGRRVSGFCNREIVRKKAILSFIKIL